MHRGMITHVHNTSTCRHFHEFDLLKSMRDLLLFHTHFVTRVSTTNTFAIGNQLSFSRLIYSKTHNLR